MTVQSTKTIAPSNSARENPRDVAAYLQLIDLYERTGELDRQRAWLAQLVALAPKSAEYRLKLALLLVHLDDLDRTDAARERVAALLASAKDKKAMHAKALESYETCRLNDFIEAHLKAERG